MMTTDPLFRVEGLVVVVTGGSGILCGTMAKALAARGAKVAILGRTPEKVTRMVSDIEAAGGQALGLVADVTNRQDLKNARQTVVQQWGRVDVLINGAGGNMPGATIAPDQNFFDDLNFDGFQQVVDLNLNGAVLSSLVFGQVMARQKKGSILHISSMTAAQAVSRVVGYSTAKAAVDAFTRWLAVEAAQKFGPGIRVNAIAPGFFITDQNRALLTTPDGRYTERGESVIQKTPAGRFGAPEELIGACLWLCSDASVFVTGTIIPVDGGFSAWSGV